MNRVLFLSMAAIAAVPGVGVAHAAATAGTLEVLQVHSIESNTNAAAVSLLGYNAATLSSSPVSTLNLPSTGSLALTLGGDDEHDGMLRLSGNGQYLTFAGYRANQGDASPWNTYASSVNRVIGVYNIATQTANTSQALTDAYNYAAITSVVTQDGTKFWTAGGVGYNNVPAPAANPTNFDLSGGVRYVSSTSATTSTNIGLTQTTSGSLQPDSDRSILIAQNQLYITTASQGSYKVTGSDGNTYYRGLYQVGTNTPITGNTSPTYTPLMNDLESGTVKGQEITTDSTGKFAPKTDLVFADLNPAIPGYDTAYGTGGKSEYEKWSLIFNPTTSSYAWKQVAIWDLSKVNGNTGSGSINALALSVEANGSTVDLYASADAGIYHFVDTSGYTSTPAASITQLPSSTVLSYAILAPMDGASQTEFRGLAFVPAVPEPASISLLGCAAGLMLLRRRR